MARKMLWRSTQSVHESQIGSSSVSGGKSTESQNLSKDDGAPLDDFDDETVFALATPFAEVAPDSLENQSGPLEGEGGRRGKNTHSVDVASENFRGEVGDIGVVEDVLVNNDDEDDDVLYLLNEEVNEPEVKGKKRKACRAEFGLNNRTLWCPPCHQKKKCMMTQSPESKSSASLDTESELENGVDYGVVMDVAAVVVEDVDVGVDSDDDAIEDDVLYKLTPKAMKEMKNHELRDASDDLGEKNGNMQSDASQTSDPFRFVAKSRRKSVVVVFVKDPPYIVAPDDVKEDFIEVVDCLSDGGDSSKTASSSDDLSRKSFDHKIDLKPALVRRSNSKTGTTSGALTCKKMWPKNRKK